MIRDLSVVVVSHNARAYIRPALRSLYSHMGPLGFEVVVVDNGTDGAADEVARHFPDARVLTCPNHGFAHANNVALRTVDARYVLLLNPDTEILEGRLSDLVARLDERPRVGLASVSQVTADGIRWPTIKRYPSPARTFAEAIGATRLVSASFAATPTSARRAATGWLVRSCSSAARRSRAPAGSTSASSSTPRRPTSVSGSGRRDGTFAISP